MRKSIGLAIFLFGIVLAACGGGGGKSGGLIPGGPPNTAPGTGTPTSAKRTNATLVLHIPAANQQQRARRPFYISSSTQSVAILVAPNASATPSPVPTAQVFPVTAPSPCATVAAGGETCTFVVQAPVGNDVFTVATYATAGPNASTIPLSLVQGTATVSAVPNPSASPLSFALNAVVASVTVNVPVPDPGNTPDTQVFTAGLAASPVPLAVSALDASGNTILSDPASPFANPISIQFSPPPNVTNTGGFKLAFNATCSTSGTSGSSLFIGCPADLGNVTLSYDGSIHDDANNHIVDSMAIVASMAGVGGATPSPASAAHAVLQSNVITYAIPNVSGQLSAGLLQPLSNGTIAYLFSNSSGWGVGTFNPSNGTVSAPTMNSTSGYNPLAWAISPSLSQVWIADQASGDLICYPGLSAINTNPATVIPSASFPSPAPVGVYSVAYDTSGNLWYEGMGSSNSENYAGYLSASQTTSCSAAAGTSPSPQFTLAYYDTSHSMVAAGSGVAFSGATGTWPMSAGMSSPNPIAPAIAASSSPIGGGVAASANGTLYTLFSNGSYADLESIAQGGPSKSVVTLPPAAAVDYYSASPQSPSVFSNASAAPDRVAYNEANFDALGYVDSLQSSAPSASLIDLPNATTYGTAFAPDGTALILFTNNLDGNVYIARVLPTTTWNVPVNSFGACGAGLLSVVQRGAISAPFTVTVTGTGVTAFPFPGGSNVDTWLSNNGSATSFSITVSDPGGRSHTYTANITGGCG